MKTISLLEPIALCCALSALVGCASTDELFESSLNEENLKGDESLSRIGLSGPAILDEHVFRNLVRDTNSAAKETFNSPDQNGDEPIKVNEFPTQATAHSNIYPFFGNEKESINEELSEHQQEFQLQGLRLFSLRF